MSSKNIRVYELAKQLNKTSKEVMAVLAEKNIEVTTHMATLEENQVSMVRAKLGEPKPAKEEKQAPKQEATPAQAQTQEAKPAPKKKKFIVVHNPENSRDKKNLQKAGHIESDGQNPEEETGYGTDSGKPDSYAMYVRIMKSVAEIMNDA